MFNFLRGTKSKRVATAVVCLLMFSSGTNAAFKDRSVDPRGGSADKNILRSAQALDNYSFDFSDHILPKAYEYHGASV